ncbi:MAG TPA: Vms1/Ankzf1 family peptidyl-tRNA hydrolase [Vicinamibacterales bacterium]|jgi:peptide chain release factor subunit 1
MPTLDQLAAQLDRLASLEPGPFPVVSLYLNTQPDQNGRDHFEPFLKKELAERLRTYPASGPERASLEKDADKIREYVAGLDPSANGLAIFACAGAELFDAVVLAAPIREHRLYVSDQPHLYPLARLIDEYPRYAALLADTHSARIFVFAGNAVEHTEQIEGVKTKRHKMGGWSQARYQRHTENYHVHHAKEVVDALARIVRDESIRAIVMSGDEVIVPLLKEQLPKDLAARVIDVVKLEIQASEREVLEKTIAALREKDVETDRGKVEELLGAYRANGLAVVGVDETRKALERGQVDELVITASPASIGERAADELVAKARQTAATICFIEDPALLSAVGSVGALLRFKV